MFTLTISGVLLGASVLVFFLVVYEWLTFSPYKPASRKPRSLGNVGFSKGKLPPGEIDTIVIGSGQGGLSCAAMLAQFGQKVVVCEQHEVTGGGAHTFAIAGQSAKFQFHSGHHLSIPLHQHLLHLACGASQAPVPFGSLQDADGANDRVVLGGAAIKGGAAVNEKTKEKSENGKKEAGTAKGDRAEDDEKEEEEGEVPLAIKGDVEVKADLCARFPSHAENIKAYFDLAESVQLRFAFLILSSLLPSWLRSAFVKSPFMALWRKWAGVTSTVGLETVLPGDDEAAKKLRSYAIGLWLDVGSPPQRSSFFMQTAVFGGWQKVGVAYPKGSPQATALALVEAIEHEGKGRVFVRCPVVEILREAVPDPSDAAEGAGKQQGQGLVTTRTRAVGVRLADGTELRARNVVSALGYRVTETLLASTTAAPNNANTVGTNSNSSAASTKAGGGGGGGGGDHGSSISSAPTPTASPPLGPVSLPLKPLATPQGCGFVMANIGLVGTAAELGITFSNLWVQPATAENGWDALKGVEEFMKDPLGCPLDLLPVGICFPSTKDKASSSSSSKNTCESGGGGGGGGCGGDDNGDDPGFHTCQILIPAEWSWFSMHAPKPPRDGTPLPWARHATTHHAAGSKSSAKHSGSNGATAAGGGGGGGGDGNGAAAVGERTDPEGYAKLKAAWSSRLLQVLFKHYPKIASKEGAIKFVDLSTPLTIETFTRPGQGAAIGLDVTPERFVDAFELEETNHKHPRVEGLWRAGQDYLMTGQVLAAASGLICALRMLGPLAMLRFGLLRAPRLMGPALWEAFFGSGGCTDGSGVGSSSDTIRKNKAD